MRKTREMTTKPDAIKGSASANQTQNNKVKQPGAKTSSTVKSERIALQAQNLSKTEYETTMARIETLMNKGSEHVSMKELAEIRTLSLLAQGYEQRHYLIEPPTTFAGILEHKMYELKLNQGQMARKLNLSPAKLSLIINCKQKPDATLIKTVFHELHIDPQILLQAL